MLRESASGCFSITTGTTSALCVSTPICRLLSLLASFCQVMSQPELNLRLLGNFQHGEALIARPARIDVAVAPAPRHDLEVFSRTIRSRRRRRLRSHTPYPILILETGPERRRRTL